MEKKHSNYIYSELNKYVNLHTVVFAHIFLSSLVMFLSLMFCGSLGAQLVVEPDSSWKEGPAVPLLHTPGVNQSLADAAVQSCISQM